MAGGEDEIKDVMTIFFVEKQSSFLIQLRGHNMVGDAFLKR
jgi:hypothetical protein